MPRFKLQIEYAGTRYSGWQIQKNARTVQGEIDRAVGTVCGRRDFELYGSGRTDAGVHALAQVAHLDVQTRLRVGELVEAVNGELPADINILSAQAVAHRFHARHDAVARSYLYQIARRRTAFAKAYVWWVKERLDLPKMELAAAAYAGMHDYRAFTDRGPGEASTDVLVDRVQLEDVGDLLLVRVEGSHFLWKMVRRMVGVLVEVGRGGVSPDAVARLLAQEDDDRDRSAPDRGTRSARQRAGTNAAAPVPAKFTAPAAGLFLERVFYPGDRRDYPLSAATPIPHQPAPN